MLARPTPQLHARLLSNPAHAHAPSLILKPRIPLPRSPELSCVYHSEDAENQFLRDPRHAVLGDGVVQGRLQGQGRGGSQGGEGSSGGGDGLTLE